MSLKCGWCEKRATILVCHIGRYWPRRLGVFDHWWVCLPCVGKRERLADKISALHWEIDEVERGLHTIAIPEFAS